MYEDLAVLEEYMTSVELTAKIFVGLKNTIHWFQIFNDWNFWNLVCAFGNNIPALK
jgi:hypothetical protein